MITPVDLDLQPELEWRDYEVLNGLTTRLPCASAAHNFLLGKLTCHLARWLETRGTGVVLPGAAFRIGENRLRPDVALLSREKWLRSGAEPLPLPEPPDIAVEIISPSDLAVTLDIKIAAYLAFGVLEVWALYQDTEHLYIHTTDGIRRLDRDSFIETPLIPGWSLPMSDLLSKDNGVYF